MCRKKLKKKSRGSKAKTETETKIEVNKNEDVTIDSDEYSCISSEELYFIRKSNYSEKTTEDLKKIRNILEGKIYRYEVNSTHANKIYAFLAVIATIFTIMFGCFKKEDDFTIGVLVLIMAIFASGCLWVFYKENKNAELYQNNKETCIVRIGIINDILEEREKAESNNTIENIDTEKHIDTKQ